MSGPLAAPIPVTPAQQAVLTPLVRRATGPQALVLRAKLVLAAADGQRNEPLARHLHCTPKTVRKWRARGGRRRPVARRGPRPGRPGASQRRRLGGCAPARGARHLHRRADRPAPQPGVPPAGAARAARRRLDAARVGRRSGQPRHRRHDCPPHGGALLQWRPIASRAAAGTGATPRPQLRTRSPSRGRWKPAAPSTPTPRCWKRWAATSSAPTS